jgi:hypothetical protein
VESCDRSAALDAVQCGVSETAHAENLPGGFSAIYDVMKALEESGKIRRGYLLPIWSDAVCDAPQWIFCVR